MGSPKNLNFALNLSESAVEILRSAQDGTRGVSLYFASLSRFRFQKLHGNWT